MNDHGLTRPRTRDALAAFLRQHLDLDTPHRALLEGHDAPLDYLWHAFEETSAPRDCILWANRGGGKTFLGAVATLLDLVFKDGIEIRILGGSMDQSARMHAHLRALFAREPFASMIDGRITQTRLRLTNGSEVQLLAQSQTSVRGTRVQKLRCDEVELFDPEVWEAAQLVTREKQCGPPHDPVFVPGSIECLSTMHVPHGIMHRLVRETGWGGATARHEDARGRGLPATRRLLRWGVVDVLGHCPEQRPCDGCPLQPECAGRAKGRAAGDAGHISVDEAIRLKQRVSLTVWESEMLCLRARRDDCVLPEFDPAAHIIDELPPTRPDDTGVGDTGVGDTWVGGIDFGIRAPTVVLWGVLSRGVLRIVGEHAAAGLPLAAHARAIREAPWPVPQWFGVDPAGAQRSLQTGLSDAQALRRMGFEIVFRSMHIEEGLDLLRARLRPAHGPPTLFIHARCRRLIESLERYRYPPDRPEALTPVKDGSDHAVDALRYLVQHLDAPYETKRTPYTA